MFLKFTISLLACTWGFSCAQDISGPEEDSNAPAAEEARGKSLFRTGKRFPLNPWMSTASKSAM